MSTKSGRGRPTRYNSKIPVILKDYTSKCLVDGIFPTIEGFATHLGIGVRTIYDWEVEHFDFSQTLDLLRATQKQLLVTNGLTGGYNTRFAMFLLKANHGMSEKDPLISATQNSFMNISPELLADALKLMNENEAK
jgi:hypothetical protein